MSVQREDDIVNVLASSRAHSQACMYLRIQAGTTGIHHRNTPVKSGADDARYGSQSAELKLSFSSSRGRLIAFVWRDAVAYS